MNTENEKQSENKKDEKQEEGEILQVNVAEQTSTTDKFGPQNLRQ